MADERFPWIDVVGSSFRKHCQKPKTSNCSDYYPETDIDPTDEHSRESVRSSALEAVLEVSNRGFLRKRGPLYENLTNELMDRISKISSAEIGECLERICTYVRKYHEETTCAQILAELITKHYDVGGTSDLPLSRAGMEAAIFTPEITTNRLCSKALISCVKYRATKHKNENLGKLNTQGIHYLHPEAVRDIVDYGIRYHAFNPDLASREIDDKSLSMKPLEETLTSLVPAVKSEPDTAFDRGINSDLEDEEMPDA